MAFHPFQFFRKRQKSFLAVLTIFVMFIFILSYGKGDAFEWAMSIMGAGRDRKDKTEVTTLYGKTVTVGELDELKINRKAVNVFIQRAMASAEPNLSAAEQQDVFRRMMPIFQDPRGGPGAARQRMRALQQDLIKEGKPEAARYLANFNRTMALSSWQQTHPGELYFGGTLTADGLLDFLLWKQQADRLKITLTDEDVRKLVNQEAGHDVLTGNDFKDGEKIRLLLQGAVRQISMKDLYAALRDEFRVRLAQDALLGNSPGARAALGTGLAGDDLPAGATPEQFWEYFKDKRTTLDVGFLRVPVSQFTGQVKEEPSEKELKDLFERYKNEEPSPEREKPALKVPRRIKVEWVSANPDAAYYRQESGKTLQLLAAVRPLMTTSGAGGFPAVAMALGAGLIPDLEIHAEYDAYVKGIKSWWDASTVLPDATSPYATGLRRADTVASVLGQILGSAATGADPLSAVVTLNGSTELRLAEQRARAASIALAGSSPFVPGVVAQEAAYVNVPVPPLAAVRETMAERARTRLGPQLAQGALETFAKDLGDKRFNPKDAAEFVQKNADAAHGITAHGVMAEARDASEIAGDQALAPLKGARLQQLAMTPQEARAFADTLFKPNQLYHPEKFERNPGDTLYYFWLTENDKAYVPTFADAKPKVEAAWKVGKARELARKAAEDVIEAMKKRPEGTSAERFLRDEAARRGYEWYTPVTPVAKMVTVLDPMAGLTAATQYGAYKFDETRFPYPRPDTVDKLFQNLKEADDATVVKDRPDRNYYVAALLKKPAVPTEKEFFDVYQRAPRGFLSDSLWARFQAERDDHYRTELVKHFRTQSQAPLDEDGDYKIDPDVRKRIGSRSDTGEE
jgi:hypothetical protein